MAEQLAYPSATVETITGPGAWQIVDPTLQANSPDDVLRDGSDATYIESDCTWQAGTRPSVLMRVQTLAGKLPLRRPYIGAQLLRIRFRYRVITGGGSVGVGPLLDVVDYASDHPSVDPTLPSPGRRNVLTQQAFNTITQDGNWNEAEATLPAEWLKGHEGGIKSIGFMADKQGVPLPYDSDLGVRISVPSALTGSPRLQISSCWYRIEEVERGESLTPDYTVKRLSTTGFEVIDNTGNWGANGGTYWDAVKQSFRTVFESGNNYSGGGDARENCKMAIVDACRRAGLTKQYSGTAIVEVESAVYSGTYSALAQQPNANGFQIGKSSTSKNYIYWRAGTPGSPGGLAAVDGLVLRSEVVLDGYRDGNNRLCVGTLTPTTYNYDGTYQEHGTISMYGLRFWAGTTAKAAIYNGSTGGKPMEATTLDLHDCQVTGTTTNSSGGTKANNSEYTWGGRIAGMRHDFRHVRFGRGEEHSYYGTAPQGDSQFIDCGNTFAASFYPNHNVASTVPHNANSTFQFVARTISCASPSGNTPGGTPPGFGTLLWEGCFGKNGTGTHFKCTGSLGKLIIRRCRSQGVNGGASNTSTQRMVQITAESFNVVGQWAPPPKPLFGVDYSMGSYDGSVNPCTKGGGSNNPIGPSSQAYPNEVPANNKWNYVFQEVVLEDLWPSGYLDNTVAQIAGARRVIIDRGWNSTGKWPMYGLWEWNGDVNNPNHWRPGTGAFDNVYVYFRNVGTTPQAWYSSPSQNVGGVLINLLALYGSRRNAQAPTGFGTVPYFTQQQLVALAYSTSPTGPPDEHPSAYPPWHQTQKPDNGGSHNWLFPCVRQKDWTSASQYGGYVGNSRRYPNFNPLVAPVERGRDMPMPIVSASGGGGGVSITVPQLDRGRDVQTPTVGLDIYITVPALERGRDVQSPTVDTSVTITVPQLERGRDIPAPSVGLEDILDFSNHPATINLDVGLPEIVTDAPTTPGADTHGVTVGGPLEGGVS